MGGGARYPSYKDFLGKPVKTVKIYLTAAAY
jgi:hypothetical protein